MGPLFKPDISFSMTCILWAGNRNTIDSHSGKVSQDALEIQMFIEWISKCWEYEPFFQVLYTFQAVTDVW